MDGNFRAKDFWGPCAMEKIFHWEGEAGPEFVTAVPRLERDLSALIKLTSSKQPRKGLIRAKDRAKSWYILGDTSQYKFGTGLFYKGRLMFES